MSLTIPMRESTTFERLDDRALFQISAAHRQCEGVDEQGGFRGEVRHVDEAGEERRQEVGLVVQASNSSMSDSYRAAVVEELVRGVRRLK